MNIQTHTQGEKKKEEEREIGSTNNNTPKRESLSRFVCVRAFGHALFVHANKMTNIANDANNENIATESIDD